MLTAAATFLLVFLRAVQQLNVVHRRYVAAALTSGALAFAEASVIIAVVNIGWDAVIYTATGGALGVTSAIYIYRGRKS